eukprot:TRINITY_DN1283_c0_g1_i1.p1 TRINITY_DN1283_c0_g1~~TRINITY_DN1283_c0_g1_i1.p1  ORF type:complete len:222 (-),score=20.19 TRINITY_DN1283_c0_g1_i1:24-689(-)
MIPDDTHIGNSTTYQAPLLEKEPPKRMKRGERVEGTRITQIPEDEGPASTYFDFTEASHPFIAFFHILFKLVAIVCYIVLEMLVTRVTTYIVVVLCAAFDFWLVKNITGRILVGLRWMRRVDEEGEHEWVFESHESYVALNKNNKNIFWWGQVVSTGFWMIIGIVDLFSLNLSRIVCTAVCAILAGTNLYGYYRCSKEYQKRVRNFIAINGLTLLRAVNRI